MIRFELPDGAVKEFSSPVAASEVVRSISEGLLRAAVWVRGDGGVFLTIRSERNFRQRRQLQGFNFQGRGRKGGLQTHCKPRSGAGNQASLSRCETGNRSRRQNWFLLRYRFFSADNPRRFQGYRGGNEQNRQIGFCRRKIRRFR